MLRKCLSASVALTFAFAPPVLAQSSNPACRNTQAITAQSGGKSFEATSMAATTSDSGNRGTGASSASIGTGPTDKTGDYSPCLPGAGGHGATGALPANQPQ